MNTPDTEKCEHNVVKKYCFRCKRPDLACRCNCLNFYKIECDCPCHSHVEIEQNAETGEILTANGIDLTPQKKGGWEEDFELCFRYFFMDMADGAVKHDIKCFIRTLLTSRDTYWKERVQKEVDELWHDLGKYQGWLGGVMGNETDFTLMQQQPTKEVREAKALHTAIIMKAKEKVHQTQMKVKSLLDNLK